MGSRKIGLGLGVVVVFGFLATAYGEVRYTITDLGTLGGNRSVSYSVNDSGQVVGCAITSDGQTRAFLWQAAAINGVGPQNAEMSVATGINHWGQTVGFWIPNSNEGRHGFLDTQETVVDIAVPGAESTDISGINDLGQLVGWAKIQGGDQAFLWNNGSWTDLPTINIGNSYAYAVNASTQIVGAAETAEGNLHASLWQNDGIEDLGTLGGLWSEAFSINSSAQIAGISEVNTGWWHAFFLDGETMTDIGTLGGEVSAALGINSSGYVVGYSDVVPGNGQDYADDRAFLWKDGTIFNLNDLIPPNSGWLLEEARSISDSGYIVGAGITNGEMHGYLLTPITVPEPATVLFIFIGPLGVGATMRRNRREMH